MGYPQTYQEATQLAEEDLRKWTNSLKLAASKAPDNAQAQFRAKAAILLYGGVKAFAQDFDQDEGDDDGGNIERGDYTDRQPASTLPGEQARGAAVHLPDELYLRIISFVDKFEDPDRRKALIDICCSCSTLRRCAEIFLYARPRNLGFIEQQWQFLFSLAVNPHLGRLVRSLTLRWLMRNENGNLLRDILRHTPNLQALTILRGDLASHHDVRENSPDHITHFASLLALCPKLAEIRYHTDEEDWGFEEDGWRTHIDPDMFVFDEESLDRCKRDSRFEVAAQKLTHLELIGETGWLGTALLPHLSPKLRALTIKNALAHLFPREVLPNLPLHSPNLQELWVHSYPIEMSDIMAACLGWKDTLRDLCLWLGKDVYYLPTWVTQHLHEMAALRSLEIEGFSNVELLNNIAQSFPPQQLTSLCFWRLQSGTRDPRVNRANSRLQEIADGVENSLCQIIDLQSETLESLRLVSSSVGSQTLIVRKIVLQGLKRASKLTELWVAVDEEVEASDIDDLLDACPNLHIFPQEFLEKSRRREEWVERKAANPLPSDRYKYTQEFQQSGFPYFI